MSELAHRERDTGQEIEEFDAVAVKHGLPARFVPREAIVEIFREDPEIDFEQFRADVYAFVDPSPRPWPGD